MHCIERGQREELQIPSDTKEIVAKLLAAFHFFPPQPRNVQTSHTKHSLRSPSGLLLKKCPHLRFVDVLVPVMCTPWHNLQQIFRQNLGRNPATPRSRNRAKYHPSTRPHMPHTSL
ncbi:hypothetical protein ABW19_dt0203719 [Dactylella cylindrospora]|nr:hypothetical protein ABW19_dt0203719 [Dactylella cylindrospora]